MKLYTVSSREVHISHSEVLATSESDAIQRVIDGEGDEVEFEFSHRLGREHTTAEVTL